MVSVNALRFLAALMLLIVAGCDSARFENTKLEAGQANPERRTVIPYTPDRPVILMTFSGGGSRAAALAESVLKELALTSYSAPDGKHVLSSDVALISSVSGGSVTAAWFGLNRDSAHPDGRLDDLRSGFLVQDNMSELELEALNPVTWFRLGFTDFTRIEALEQLFDEKLFHGAPLGQINQPGKPFIILNTTDMAGGETFALTPRRFDDICSNYDALPASTGVAASAAFPVFLSPVSFQDFAQGCIGKLRDDQWARIDLSNPYTPYLTLEEFRDARYTNDLRHGQNVFRKIDYLYFLDGGVADNLGGKSLRAALIAPYDDAGVLRAINNGQIHRLVIIVVNARSDSTSPLYTMKATPGIFDSIDAITWVPIDANMSSSQLELAELLDTLATAAETTSAAMFKNMKVYGVTVDFDLIPADTDANRRLRDRVNQVPTSWTLAPDQLATVETAGRTLLRADPCYKQLIADLHARPPEALSAAALPVCPTKK